MKKTMVIMICIIGLSLSGIIWGETLSPQEEIEKLQEQQVELGQEVELVLERLDRAIELGQKVELEKEAELGQKGLQVKEFALCEGIREREPVAEKTIFPSDVGRVYFWTNIYGADEPTTVTHAWYYQGEKIAEVPLEIKYFRTRTWSSKTIPPERPGDWRVEVVDGQGKLLKEVAFVVENPAEIKVEEKIIEKEEAPLFPESEPEAGLELEVKLGAHVEKREILGESESFPANIGRVYCWSLVTGAEEPTTITHTWYYGQKKIVEVPLSIKYPRTRTWSYKTILPEQAGNWYVEVVDINGNLLKKVSFQIEPQ